MHNLPASSRHVHSATNNCSALWQQRNGSTPTLKAFLPGSTSKDGFEARDLYGKSGNNLTWYKIAQGQRTASKSIGSDGNGNTPASGVNSVIDALSVNSVNRAANSLGRVRRTRNVRVSENNRKGVAAARRGPVACCGGALQKNKYNRTNLNENSKKFPWNSHANLSIEGVSHVLRVVTKTAAPHSRRESTHINQQQPRKQQQQPHSNTSLSASENVRAAVRRSIALSTTPQPIQTSATFYTTPAPSTSTTFRATTTTTTTTTKAKINYILITDYDQLQERTFWQKYGRILLIAVGISFGIACISVLVATVHCYRAAALSRRATGALALPIPIPLLPEDQTLLHTEPEHPVPMLSVQTAGCAGMERLGVPTRTSLNTPPDDRGQFSCRLRVDALQTRELLAVHGETVIRNNNTTSSSSNHQQHHHHHKQHTHHKQHSHNHHHLQQQQQQQLQQQQQQQHYQRMTTPNSSGISGISGSGTTPTRCNNSISNSNGGNITPATNGIEATALKYGNTGSGSGGSSSGGSSYGSSSGSSVNSHSNDHHQHYQHQLQQQQTLRCPHHVPLPDSEWGQDRNLQIRTGYQQSEITRSYIKPPPNKTIKDVPEQSAYNLYTLTSSAASLAQQHYAVAAACSSGAAVQQQPHKSKPNVITKLFSRKSSPKSPTAMSASSTCSSLASSASISSVPSASSSASSLASVSTSSSASSLSAAPIATLPTSTAAVLKSTACNYGSSMAHMAATSAPAANISAGLAPSTQLLTTIGVSPTVAAATAQMERIPTPPLSVCVPIGYQQQQQQQQQQHKQFQQQQQHLLLDSFVAESSSCSLATSSLDALPTTSAAAALLAPTTAAAGISRNNSNSSMSSYKACNCKSKNCSSCAAT